MEADLPATIPSTSLPVVVLINGDQCYELVKKDGDDLTVMSWNRYCHRTVEEMAGFKATPAVRVVKGNGTWMYGVTHDEGTDWYVAGKRFPAVRKKR